MSIFKGLLYVKHDKLGTKSEGPVYRLQTIVGEYTLKYERRHPWDPDYHLEFFARSIVEVEGELQDDRQIQVKQIDRMAVSLVPTRDLFAVKIRNTGVSAITDISLHMVGALGGPDGLKVARLGSGDITDQFQFELLIREEGQVPSDYGDYLGTYCQAQVEKSLNIPHPANSITIEIDDKGFSVD